jgi:hypothetical protein
VIRIEHERLAESDEQFEVELTQAALATVHSATADESGVRSPLRTWVTVTIEVTRIDGHR